MSAQNISFTSSLEATGRTYVCPDEVVSYVCSGTGDEINLYAPPYVNLSQALSFARGDTPGSGLGRGPIISNLISTPEDPLMVAGVLVPNPLLPEFTIFCEVVSPSRTGEVVHKPAGMYSHMYVPIVFCLLILNVN